VKDAVRAWKQSRREVFVPLSHPPGEAQVEYAFDLDVVDADSIRVILIRVILEHRRESPVALFSLDGRPHLKTVHVPLIVTTNLPFEHWTEVLGSERLTGAALDRLTHRCHILEAKGESYRLQDAKRRRRSGG